MAHATEPLRNPWPHRLAVALCCAAFPLIWVGGLVTSYDAGMAVPDWPTTYGYNLFLYPWQTWVWGPFDLFVEHSHRLLGALVGLLALALVFAVLMTDNRRWLRSAAIGAAAMVILQGILGGVRVRMDERWLAMVHGCFGLATFGYLTAMAVVTSRAWQAAGETPQAAFRAPHSSLPRLCWLTAAVIYAQVVLGALLRHVPVSASHQFFRAAVWLHLLLAVGVIIHAVLVTRAIRREGGSPGWLVRPARSLQLLIAFQVMLGVGTWIVKYGWPVWFAEYPLTAGYTIEAGSFLQGVVATAHVAVGAVIFATSLVIALRAARFFRSVPVTASSGVLLLGWSS